MVATRDALQDWTNGNYILGALKQAVVRSIVKTCYF